MKGFSREHTIRFAHKGTQMIRKARAPSHMQSVARLVQAFVLAAIPALYHARMMAVMFSQGMENDIVFSVFANGENQAKIRPLNSHVARYSGSGRKRSAIPAIMPPIPAKSTI
jgi:hypothetical protein